MSEFDAFGSSDPAADFLAKEEAELAKIENNDPFDAFESAVSSNASADPFSEMDQLASNANENLNINENESNVIFTWKLEAF